MLRKSIVFLRKWYLVHVKWKKYSFGVNFHVGRNVLLWAKKNIVIGDNVYIGRDSQIECNTTIGNDVLIANNVALIGKYDHHYQQIGIPISQASRIRDVNYDWLELDNKVSIGNDVWIGYGVIILSGVKIGNGCIISAGSVVVKDTKPYTINAGIPAKYISDRFNSEDDKNKHIAIYENQGIK